MKRILAITIALVVVLAGSALAVQNVIRNGDFGVLNDKGLPTEWIYGKLKGEVEINTDDQDTKEGKYALRMDGFTGDSLAQIQQSLDIKTVVPGEVYRFNMWYKTKRMEISTRKDPFTVPVVVRLRFKDVKGNYIKATEDLIKSVKQPQQVVYYSNLHLGATELRNGEWSQYQVDFRVPAEMTSMWVEVFLWNAAGMLWLDDLQMTRMSGI